MQDGVAGSLSKGHRMSRLRHRVVPTRVEGIATQDPPHSHQPALEHAVFVNGFVAVMGTGGVKTTGVGRKKPGKSHLVQPNEGQQYDARPVPGCFGQCTQGRQGRIGRTHEKSSPRVQMGVRRVFVLSSRGGSGAFSFGGGGFSCHRSACVRSSQSTRFRV